ncbi:MAG: dephospho-CoA kinase [Saprospiraceae bacterium]|nr:dephospho-CoA kinase [Saprospiraceae bacterium]
MRRVGITGGIGTGKTTVCKIFESLGVPVFYADECARYLLNHQPELVDAIKKLFGAAAYGSDGSYQRKYIAEVAFSNPEKLSALNALVHPAVEKEALLWHEQQLKKGVSYTIKEAALMLESQSHLALDFLIVVTAPESLRIKRVMQRDQATKAQVLARMNNQLPESEKIKIADAIIINDETHSLIRQVWDIHQALS